MTSDGQAKSDRRMEEWQQWAQNLGDGLPSKSRYQRFYAEVDRELPGWRTKIRDAAFLAWAAIPDTEDGVCMLDRLSSLWSNPAYNASAFASLLRYCFRVSEVPTKQPTALEQLLRRRRTAPATTRSCPILFERYEVIANLGRGGNGEVHLVWSRETQTIYALKLIKHELLQDVVARQSFRGEAATWIAMGDHPNVAKAFFFEELSGQLMVTMTFVDSADEIGPSLGDKIDAGQVTEKDAARWFVEVSDGLAHAYASGIRAHRDIKPGNILINSRGSAQVTDFGLAVPIDSAQELNVAGTPYYMAPEQFESAHACDVQSDIYSLGVTLYQVLSGGALPFAPKYDASRGFPHFMRELRAMHLHASPRKLNSPFWPVIARCLDKDPNARFANVVEFRNNLAKIALRLGYPVPVPPKAEIDVWTLRDQGNTFYRLGKYAQAIEAFDMFLAVFQDYAAAFNRACCLENLGRYSEALAVYRPLAAQSDTKALINGSHCLRKLGDIESALDFASTATRLSPNEESAWIALGNIRYAQQSWQEAFDAYLRAHQLRPQSSTPLYNAGLAALAMSERELAEKAFRSFLEVATPDDTRRAFVLSKLQVRVPGADAS